MAYAPTPHIEAHFEPVGTGTPYKVNWVNNVAGVLIAAGWTPEVSTHTGSNGPYMRTIAATVVRISQTDPFDSFSLFSSPPADPCDGLGAWSISQSGAPLNVGTDVTPSNEFFCCCLNDGDCPCGTASCGTVGADLCTVDTMWSFTLSGNRNTDMVNNHAALVTQVFNQSNPSLQHTAIYTCTTTDTAGSITNLTSYHAVWVEGGSSSPLQGAVQVTLPIIGAAFNAGANAFHGGWVLHSQPSNTDENKITVYIGVDRESEGPGDIVAATYPFCVSFSTYTAQTHPIQYTGIGDTCGATLSGKAHRNLFRNDDNDMRLIANPYHAIMYSHINGTASGTGSLNTLVVGALRTVPLSGEDPNDPDSWSFKKAVFHSGDNQISLHQQNWINPDVTSWYMTIEGTNTLTKTTAIDEHQLCVGGFHWADRVKPGEPACTWISGEAFYSEPWAGFFTGTATTAVNCPILGQIWDCIVPSKAGGSGYFFWDGEWWLHWQHLRTDTGSAGGPISNIGFRVGFQTLEGEGPTGGIWPWPVSARDVFLYNLQQAGVLSPFPWGNMTGISISNSTFSGGTTTRTLTVTCTAHPDAPSDGTKLVALHSERNYFTFTPEVVSLGSGTTSGTALVSALSPGLGGATATIYADSITQVSINVTVND